MIIDTHTHIFPSFFRDERAIFFPDEQDFAKLYGPSGSKMAGVQDLLNDMDDAAVEKSVIFGFPWRTADHFRRHNDYILESVQQHPDRLTGFCCFDFTSPESPMEAERCLNAGLSGIGELGLYDSDFSPDAIDALKDIMEIALHRDAPVLLHTNEPVGHSYPGKQPMTLGRLYTLIKRYPSNHIILAHWGAGIFFYGLMKKEVKETLGNVWLDTAASPYLYAPEIYRVAGEIAGFEKILFGSDYPLIKPSRYFPEMESLGLSAQSLKMICGENAGRLLGLVA